MHYTKTGTLTTPPREPDEAPCTPEQATALARYCPGERFDTIRALGTWQAAKMMAEAQRIEQQFQAEVLHTEEAKANPRKSPYRGLSLAVGAIAGVIYYLIAC